MSLKFKKDAEPVVTSEFHYDLFSGGYIDPDALLEADDAKALNEAIALINQFEDELEANDLLEYT